MALRLFWIRHGQMDLRVSRSVDRAAIERLLNAEQQSGLSARGREQAERVAARLASERLDALYASPLLRAKETAEIVGAKLAMEVHIHPGIGELRTGRLRDDARAAKWIEAVVG